MGDIVKSNGENDFVESVEIVNEVKPKPTRSNTKTIGSTFTTPRKLVADYGSDSGGSSVDSESDSTPSIVDSASDSESDSSSTEGDGDEIVDEIIDTIEEIKITVPSEECQEVGKVKSIIGTRVIVEPNVGTAALDLGTILFLDQGQKALGKIEDVFGQVAEPLYSIMFLSPSDITERKIVVGTKVYYAPKTDHTSFVFLPDLLRMKGSDASWKYNREVPPEEQDFSDDEEEARVKKGTVNYEKPRKNRRSRSNKWKNKPTPSWMPPIRPPMFNLPNYPPPNMPNPYYPQGPAPSFNAAIPPPMGHPMNHPYMGYMHPPYNAPMHYPQMQPPPPGLSMPVAQSTPPPPPPPPPQSTSKSTMVQDMRHWQAPGP